MTEAEINSFAGKGGYAVLRMLERPSKGTVQAPRLDAFEQDMKDLAFRVSGLKYYRGELAPIGPGGYLGQSVGVGNTVVGGWLNTCPADLDKMAERWDVLQQQYKD